MLDVFLSKVCTEDMKLILNRLLHIMNNLLNFALSRKCWSLRGILGLTLTRVRTLVFNQAFDY